MGKSKNWSEVSKVYDPIPGGGGFNDRERVIGPRVPQSLAEALGDKGKVMTPGQASKGTNPHYNSAYDAYSSNCQRCVLTYEARRRGYDVTALPTYSGDLLPSGGDYLRGLSNPKTVDIGKSARNLNNQMASYGNGSRAIVHVRKGNRGHVFIAERSGGKTIFIDPQTNARYNGIKFSHVDTVKLTRIDNQKFTDYAKNAFTRQKV